MHQAEMRNLYFTIYVCVAGKVCLQNCQVPLEKRILSYRKNLFLWHKSDFAYIKSERPSRLGNFYENGQELQSLCSPSELAHKKLTKGLL